MGSRLLFAALVALSALYVATLVGIVFARLFYPYELDFMSGGSLDHVLHLLDGNKLYCAPTWEYVPYLYAPLHIYLSAALATVTGATFVPLRLVSFLASAAIMVLGFTLVRRQGGGAVGAIFACGLFAACYDLLDSLYDLARVDALLCSFLLATSTTLWLGKTHRSAVLAALLLTAGYFAKQTALIVAPFLCLAVFVVDRRRAVVFGAAFAVSWAASVSFAQWYYDGWFHYYTWTLARRHLWDVSGIESFLVEDLWRLYPALLAIGWLYFDAWRRGEGRTTLARGIEFGGLAVACCMSRMHVGGAANVIMPFVVAICIGAGMAIGRAARRRTAGVLIPALLVVQLAILAYEPGKYVPTEADQRANDEVVAALRETEGTVFLPHHGYLATLAGKPRHAHSIAVIDVVRGAEDDVSERLHNDFWGAGFAEECTLVVLDHIRDDTGTRRGPGYASFLWMLVSPEQVAQVYPAAADSQAITDLVPDAAQRIRAQWRMDVKFNGENVMYPVASFPTRPSVLFHKK